MVGFLVWPNCNDANVGFVVGVYDGLLDGIAVVGYCDGDIDGVCVGISFGVGCTHTIYVFGCYTFTVAKLWPEISIICVYRNICFYLYK